MKVAAVLCVVAEAAAAAPDHKWYSSAPVLPALVASSEHIAHPRCYNHSRLFLRALDNYTLWAVQMLDASVKVPHGIMDGSVSHLGHFDQCLAVSADDLRGQYCLVQISYRPASYSPTQTTYPFSLQFHPKIHAWEKLKTTEDRSRVPRSILYLGLCMPSSCTPDQLQDTLEHELRLLGEKEGLIFKASVSPRLCTTEQESPPWTAGEIVFSCSAGLLILLVIISSWYDRSREKTDPSSAVEQVLLCFSIQRSVTGLLKVTNTTPALAYMDVYRLVFSVLIILGHRVLIYNVLMPVSDANQHEQLFRSLAKSLFINGPVVVDFFFVASGTLLAFHLLNQLHAHKSVNLLTVVVIRFLRLAPIYTIVLSFYATLFYRMGSGPLWEIVLGVERERCRDNWWTNLFYINNYVNPENMCMFQSWYLAVDTQLFILSLFIVYVIGVWPLWGYTILITASSWSFLAPFLNTWWKRTDALLLSYHDVVGDLVKAEYFHTMYIRTENRASPYFIGIIVGLILVKFKDSKIKMSAITTHFCFVALKLVAVGSIMASYPLYRPGSSHTHIEAGLYACLSKVFIGISWGGVFLLGHFGTFGILKDFALWKPFRVLGRLVYGVYLVHMTGQLYNIGSLRTPQQTGVFHIWWRVMGDVMFSFALSFLLTVTLESPVRNLEKIVFQRNLREPNSQQRKKL